MPATTNHPDCDDEAAVEASSSNFRRTGSDTGDSLEKPTTTGQKQEHHQKKRKKQHSNSQRGKSLKSSIAVPSKSGQRKGKAHSTNKDKDDKKRKRSSNSQGVKSTKGSKGTSKSGHRKGKHKKHKARSSKDENATDSGPRLDSGSRLVEAPLSSNNRDVRTEQAQTRREIIASSEDDIQDAGDIETGQATLPVLVEQETSIPAVLSPDKRERVSPSSKQYDLVDAVAEIEEEKRPFMTWKVVGIIVAILITAVVTTVVVVVTRNDYVVMATAVLAEMQTPSPTILITTPPPTFPPTFTNFTLVMDEIGKYFPNSFDNFQDLSDPQFKATQWLAEGAYFQFPIPEEAVGDLLQFRQRYTLSTFFFATGGEESWLDQCYFLSSEHVCRWQCELPPGIAEAGYPLMLGTFMGVYCQNDFEVSVLEIVGNGLSGYIPQEREGLESLQVLNLPDNHLTGTIPFANLPTSLVGLFLWYNQLHDPISPSIKALSNLQILMLDWNSLSGSLPSEISFLSHLSGLALSNNLLTGPIPPSIFQLDGLLTFGCNNNLISGPIPETVFQSIDSLLLRNNVLSSTIPTSMGNLIAIRILDVSENLLSGSVPNTLAQLTRLEALAMQYNDLTGKLLEEVTLWQLTSLQQLSLSSNAFGATMNTLVGQLLSLVDLDAHNVELTGTLPTELGNLVMLNLLELSYNEFTGRVPTELAKLTNLGFLDLIENYLTGTSDFLCGVVDRLSLGNGIMADCADELVCSCCTTCCDADGECWRM